ncbi:ribose operon repressor [Coraliomargarita sp. CAG:312]|nr:ribose operon repressor [Coraliomargarita sp. CAG:312]
MRRDAAEEAAKFFGCDYSCLPVSSETSDFKAGTNIARALMDKGRENLPQAIVCATDTIAMGIIKRFYECGVRVPEDVAIVGFDDISAAANYIPSITSFRQPVKLFAQKCFNVVSENVEPQILNVEGELLIRKSTMKL